MKYLENIDTNGVHCLDPESMGAAASRKEPVLGASPTKGIHVAANVLEHLLQL